MNPKNIAIWVLSFALLGAILEVPGFFLNRVLGSSVLFAGVALVVCAIVSARKKRTP